MRGKFVWVLAIVALGAASAASGASSDAYRGTVAHHGHIHFRVTVSDAGVTRVAGLGWKRLAIRCDQGRFAFRGGFRHRSFTVEGSTFHGSGSSGGTYVSHARVTGRFVDQGARASGTVRVHGALDAHHTGCDSGTKRWRAHRTA